MSSGADFLRREVVVPPPAYRRLSAVIEIGLALVMIAGAADALVWSYCAQRRYWRAEAAEGLQRASGRRQAAERAVPPLTDPTAPRAPLAPNARLWQTEARQEAPPGAIEIGAGDGARPAVTRGERLCCDPDPVVCGLCLASGE
jgi:hypothetical protein